MSSRSQTPDTMGPTWEDVYDYVNLLEGRFHKTIFLQMRLFKAGKPERLVGSAAAIAVRRDRPVSEPVATGVHGFKGNSGAKTAPGAYWHALSELEGKLAGIETVAQSKMAF